MPILYLIIGIIVLLTLILYFKVNTFISLIITAFVTAILLGLPFNKIVVSIEHGMGGLLGHLGIIFGMGAMLGKLVADAGGAYRISKTLLNSFGEQKIQIAVIVASFIIGIALFFEVGIVLLIPIVYVIARESKISFLYLGIPMAAALNVTHGFLPPHPGPTAIATIYGANLGQVLLWGIIAAIPTTIICGPIFNLFMSKFFPSLYKPMHELSTVGNIKEFNIDETPCFGISILTSLLPVILMGLAAIVELSTTSHDLTLVKIILFIGNPSTAMLISLIFALWSMGYARARSIAEINSTVSVAIAQISMMLLIIGGGGAFKQVLVDGGVANFVEDLFKNTTASPVIIAWLVAAVLRLCVGSATVASLTAAGIVLPIVQNSTANPALMVLATGAGSVIACHVNDAGFWMIKEYFGLSMKETFLTWTTLTTVLSVAGLLSILVINIFV